MNQKLIKATHAYLHSHALKEGRYWDAPSQLVSLNAPTYTRAHTHTDPHTDPHAQTQKITLDDASITCTAKWKSIREKSLDNDALESPSHQAKTRSNVT